MTNNGIVNIHGKEYMTVAKRVEEWLKDNNTNNEGYSIETEVLNHEPVVVKATVKYRHRIFTGISAANPDKTLEKQSPYEIAETSAVGRALGFAGYGVIEGIASADEMVKAEPTRYDNREEKVAPKQELVAEANETKHCSIHDRPLKQREWDGQFYWDHRLQIEGVWNRCQGSGWKADKPRETSDDSAQYLAS